MIHASQKTQPKKFKTNKQKKNHHHQQKKLLNQKIMAETEELTQKRF